MEIQGMKIVTYIAEDDVQERAEDLIGRELTKSELENLEIEMMENRWHIHQMIDEGIDSVVSFSKLIKRNKNSETKPIHYLVYWKNENAFQKDYTQVFAALTEKDARKYIATDSLDEFEHFKITKVDRNTETEIAVIRNEHIHSPTESAEF